MVKRCAIGVLAVCAGSAFGQADSFHIMQIEQVIGGVNGDTTKQAVQLRMRTAFQNQMQNARLVAYDAAGANPVVIIAFPNAVTNFTQGDRVLVTTAAFNSATTPTATPDFTMTNPIPASYLAAGKLCFQDNFGTVYWILAWGGAAYTGPTTGSLVNDADGNFGPPFAGPCPSTGVQGLRFLGLDVDPSTSNSTDYGLTAGPATVTNNARLSFSLPGGPPLTQLPARSSAVLLLALVMLAAGALPASRVSRRQIPQTPETWLVATVVHGPRSAVRRVLCCSGVVGPNGVVPGGRIRLCEVN